MVNGDEYENIELRKASDMTGTTGRIDNRPALNQNGSSRSAGGLQSPGGVDGNDNSQQLRDMMEINRNLQNLVLGAQTIDMDRRDYSSGYGSESGDMLRELVKNKELMKTGGRSKKELNRFSSVDSDQSESSTHVSSPSEREVGGGAYTGSSNRKRPRINHHAIRSTVSEPDVDQLALVVRKCHLPVTCEKYFLVCTKPFLNPFNICHY